MSKRAQERKQSPSLDSGASYGLGNQELGRDSVFTSIGKPVRDRVQNPAMNSQEWRRDDDLFSSIGEPVRSGV